MVGFDANVTDELHQQINVAAEMLQRQISCVWNGTLWIVNDRESMTVVRPMRIKQCTRAVCRATVKDDHVVLRRGQVLAFQIRKEPGQVSHLVKDRDDDRHPRALLVGHVAWSCPSDLMLSPLHGPMD